MSSVLAGSNALRFTFGGLFPLFSTQMFLKLGAGWALSLLGFLCVLFFPAPILFYVSLFYPLAHVIASKNKSQADSYYVQTGLRRKN